MSAKVLSFSQRSELAGGSAADGESDLTKIINETRVLWRADRERRSRTAGVLPFRSKAAPAVSRPRTDDPALTFVRSVRPDLTDAEITGFLDRVAQAWDRAKPGG